MHRNDVLALLDNHRPHDESEARFLQSTIAFIARTPSFAMRSTPAGHLTASGWILDAAAGRALLVHHAKLNRWLQPGGHIEPQDMSLAAAAAREVREETGMRLAAAQPILFDVDVHAIPARGAEPEHLHYDCRFLFRAEAECTIELSDESHGYRWVPLAELLAMRDLPASLHRMALKSCCLPA